MDTNDEYNFEWKFWGKENSTDYFEWDKAKQVSLSRLKPSTKTISLRLPESVLNDIKIIANKRDVPYQSLIKIFLKERIDKEFKQSV